MKIAVITPWRVKCGIATYSEAFADALSKQDVEVYVVRLNRLGNKTVEYFETLATRRIPDVDLVIVEHEYGLYQGGEPVFYNNLRRRLGVVPLVTTMHSVGNPVPDEIVSNNSDAVVVHNKFCKERFIHDCKVIPHGVRPVDPLPMEEAKEKLGFVGPVVTLFGFIGPYKGYEEAIRTVGMEFPGVNLLVAGGWHVDLETTYIARMKDLAEALAPGQVKWTGWVDPEDLSTIFGATDVLLYCNRYATESGALLTAIGYGRCCLARALRPVLEKESFGALKSFKTEADLVLGLEELLENPEERHKYEEGARDYAIHNSWEAVAKMHIDLFEELI
jgi:glycosyltransferase involved in cell wall biosynthesis